MHFAKVVAGVRDQRKSEDGAEDYRLILQTEFQIMAKLGGNIA
jgi:hypothetical protein